MDDFKARQEKLFQQQWSGQTGAVTSSAQIDKALTTSGKDNSRKRNTGTKTTEIDFTGRTDKQGGRRGGGTAQNQPQTTQTKPFQSIHDKALQSNLQNITNTIEQAWQTVETKRSNNLTNTQADFHRHQETSAPTTSRIDNSARDLRRLDPYYTGKTKPDTSRRDFIQADLHAQQLDAMRSSAMDQGMGADMINRLMNNPLHTQSFNPMSALGNFSGEAMQYVDPRARSVHAAMLDRSQPVQEPESVVSDNVLGENLPRMIEELQRLSAKDPYDLMMMDANPSVARAVDELMSGDRRYSMDLFQHRGEITDQHMKNLTAMNEGLTRTTLSGGQWHKGHEAEDFLMRRGMGGEVGPELKSPYDGVVVEKGNDGSRGDYIIVFTPTTNEYHVMVHVNNSAGSKNVGDTVRAGETVTNMGFTGRYIDSIGNEYWDGKSNTTTALPNNYLLHYEVIPAQ